MCIGIPMQIIAIDGIKAIASENGTRHEIDLSLVNDAIIGDYVLTFLGAARHKLSEEEAIEIADAIGGLRAVLEGGDIDVHFQDLINREPQLPPHLQAAHKQGFKEA